MPPKPETEEEQIARLLGEMRAEARSLGDHIVGFLQGRDTDFERVAGYGAALLSILDRFLYLITKHPDRITLAPQFMVEYAQEQITLVQLAYALGLSRIESAVPSGKLPAMPMICRQIDTLQ